MSTLAIDSPSPRVAVSGAEHRDDALPPLHAEILQHARAAARRDGLPYAGILEPEDAWELFVAGTAELVDVRTQEELRCVGRVPNAAHAAWQLGAARSKNPRFLKELGNCVSKDAVVLLLCRSGKRSAAAAEAATRAGFLHVFNVREGCEGDQELVPGRAANSGWRQRGLPWVQG